MQDPTPSRSEGLLARASNGDALALNTLLEEHLPELRGFVRLRLGKMIRAKESSSDIVQSVCREVIQHADRFQHGGEVGFKRWLYTTALRKIAGRQDYYEAAKRDVAREVPPPRREDSAGSSYDPASVLSGYGTFCTPSRVAGAREELQRVEAAFDALSEEHREVILHCRILGMSRAETATEMGRSEGAVRALLHRALTRLAEALDKGHEA